MPRISSRVTFDRQAVMTRLRAASNEALTIMGMQALKDATKHTPCDNEGILKDSGINHSDSRAENLKFTLRWDTPYARYLWHGDVMYGNPTNRTYGPEKLSFTSALAREEWAKYAKEVYGEDWKRVLQAAMKRRARR